MTAWVVALALVGALLAAVELVRSRAQSLLAWGLLALVGAVLVTRL